MRAKVVAGVLCALLLLYMVVLGQQGVLLLRSGEPVGIVLGLGILVLPVLGVWVLVREWTFGTGTEAMARTLEAEGGLPVDDLERTPGGRIVRASGEAMFARFRAETEAAPQDWRSWFRLSCGYDAAGDRRRARRAMRHALSLYRTR